MKVNPNNPARPCAGYETDIEYPQFDHKVNHKGLTIRQEFAMSAMQGILSSIEANSLPNTVMVAEWSVRQADDLINELNK